MMFDQLAIEREERDFDKLILAPDQRMIVDQLATVVVKFLPVSKLATMGFIWKAVKEWQKKYSRALADLALSTPTDRMAAVKEMTETTAGYMKRVLRRAEDEQKIDQAFDSVYKFYVSQFSTR